MQKLTEFIKPKAAPVVGGLHPKICLSACASCAGQGKRTVNGVEWWCFSCGGSGTKVQHGGHVAPIAASAPR